MWAEVFIIGIKPYTLWEGQGKGRSRKGSWKVRGVTSLRNGWSTGLGGKSELWGDLRRQAMWLLKWDCEGGTGGKLPREAAASG